MRRQRREQPQRLVWQRQTTRQTGLMRPSATDRVLFRGSGPVGPLPLLGLLLFDLALEFFDGTAHLFELLVDPRQFIAPRMRFRSPAFSLFACTPLCCHLGLHFARDVLEPFGRLRQTGFAQMADRLHHVAKPLGPLS